MEEKNNEDINKYITTIKERFPSISTEELKQKLLEDMIFGL